MRHKNVLIMTIIIILIAIAGFTYLAFQLDDDLDNTDDERSEERRQTEAAKPDEIANATRTALAIQNQASPPAGESRTVTLTIDQLTCIEAQEDRMITVDGVGDEVYLVYTLAERDAAGNLVQADIKTWGTTRMQAGNTETDFETITLSIGVKSSVEVSMALMESEDIARADEFITQLRSDVDRVGDGAIAEIVPGGELTVSTVLFALEIGVDLLETLATDDELGTFTTEFTSDEFHQVRTEIFTRNALADKYTYQLDYRLD